MPKFSPVVSRRRRFSSVLAVLALAVLTAAGCDSSTGNDDSIASLSVNPPTPVLHIGGVQQLTATPATSSGQIIEGRTAAWASSNPGVADVDANGLVTAVAGGSTTISATIGSFSDEATVTVWHPVQSVTLASEGGATSVCQEGTLQLIPTFVDATGATVTGRQSAWTTGDASIALVNTSGMITGGPPGAAFGTTTITSVTEGVVATFDITTNCVAVVTDVDFEQTLGVWFAAGMTDQFVVTPRAASGTALDTTDRVVEFTSSDEAVATVSATGVVTMVAATGEADITATVDGVDSDPITVTAYTEIADGATIETGAIPLDGDVYWVVNVPTGATNLSVSLAGGADSDVDMIMYRPDGSQGPFSAGATSNEAVSIDNPTVGRWRIRINGFEAHPGAPLTVNVTP